MILGVSNYDIYWEQAYKDLFKGIAQSSIKSVTFNLPSYRAFTFPRDFFDPFRDKHFTHIILTGESLEVNPFMFWNVTHLVQLTISSTNIKDITPEYFEGMYGLRVLDLHENKIAYFNPNASTWNLDIMQLNLSHNNIFWLSSNAFTGLKHLEKLDLSDNPRVVLQSPPLYTPLLNLKQLDVSGTAFFMDGVFYFPKLRNLSFSRRIPEGESFFHPSILKNLVLLERFIADNSQLTLNQLWSESQNLSIFRGLVHLQVIDISSNDVCTLPLGLFPILPKLQFLNLGNNKISVVESGVFRGLDSLERLYLDHNVMSKLPNDVLASMGKLYKLFLNSNFLQYLGEGLFENTTSLRNLTLADNQITCFSQKTFAPIRSTLEYIDISRNPIQCSCQIKWLIGWRKSSIHIARANQTICSLTSDPPFRGKQVFMINPNDLCIRYINLYFALPLMAAGLLAIASVIYYKRWVIQYRMFLLKSATIGKNAESLIPHIIYDSFDFDLNIFFTIEDKDWATEYLKARLKEDLPQFDRIAFGDDDLPLGMYYLDAVLYVVEHSFKTILLLSRAATRENDFMMKLRTALNHLTNTRTQCTLLIFLEDIPDEELPHLVRLYLSEGRPHIRWVEDVMGQRYFWKKLEKHLTRDTLVPK